MKKNDYFIGECIDMSHDGQGIVKKDNFAYFVKGMITGEIGKLKVIKIVKNYGIARLIELQQASPYRQVPKCSIYKACGGCHLQHINDEGQQYFKTKRVKDCLERIGKCDVEVRPCIMMEEPWHYRNKVQVPVGYQEGRLVTGFYKQHTNDIIPYNACHIQNDVSNQITNRCRELLEQYHITSYDKITKKGNIRHILTKYGYHSKEIMLALITNETIIPHIQEIKEMLLKEFPMIKTIIQNINQRGDNVILGEKEILIHGKGYIEDTLLGNTFKISLKSFYQVNPIQVEKLYQTAIDFAKINKEDVVIDAYCGIGTISLSVARHVKQVLGVEIVPQAIKDAKENAKINSITNVEFTCIDAGEYMTSLAKDKKHIDVAFVDPPRKGCSTQFLDALVELQPSKVVYISCDAATQARDVAYLQEKGYQVDICQPCDMFPHTYHIETIVRLSR